MWGLTRPRETKGWAVLWAVPGGESLRAPQPPPGGFRPRGGLCDVAFQAVSPVHHWNLVSLPRGCAARFMSSRLWPQPGPRERPGDQRQRPRHELLPGTGGDRQRLGSDQGGTSWVSGAPLCLPEHYRPR